MTRAILVEIDVVSPAGEAQILRFADRAVIPVRADDPDLPNVAWDDRLLEPPSMRRALFDDLVTLSPGLGLGDMRLDNADGGLDGYQAYAWGEARVWRWTEGEPFASAELIMKGLTNQPAYPVAGDRASQVAAGFYDYRAELEGPLQAATFTGGNGVGGVLYEGEADGLKGRVKPLAYGRLTDAHLPAPQVNAGVQAHLLHDGPISGSVTIFDRGDAAGFADQGALVGGAFDAFSPAAASWVRDVSRGLLKINGDPAGTLTFGCRGAAAGGYVETTGPVLARMLAQAGVPHGRIGASVSAFAAAAPIGAWFGDQIAAREAIGWVARSGLAALLPDREGVWQAQALTPPAAEAHHEVDAFEIIAIEADEAAPAPVGEVRVGWGRIWTTFKGSDLAAALRGTSAAARLAEEYRWAVAEDATVKARLPRTWRTLQVTTALRQEADAQALAAALKTLFGLRPDGRAGTLWRVTVELTSERLALPLGSTIHLTYPPRGIDDRFVLIAEELMRPGRDFCIWTLWG